MDIETGGASTNLEELLQRGIRTAREGNLAGARRMFEAVLAVNKREERAWLWLASLADTKDEKRGYLETVLKLNPKNDVAHRALAAMEDNRSNTDRQTMRFGLTVVAGLVVLVIVVILVLVLLPR
jgi:thioredoxin-like negative regulator of GroEL